MLFLLHEPISINTCWFSHKHHNHECATSYCIYSEVHVGSNILLIKDKLELVAVEWWQELIAQEHLDNSHWIYCLNEREGGGRSRKVVSNNVLDVACRQFCNVLLWVMPLGWLLGNITGLEECSSTGRGCDCIDVSLLWAAWFPLKVLCRKLVMFGHGNSLNVSANDDGWGMEVLRVKGEKALTNSSYSCGHCSWWNCLLRKGFHKHFNLWFMLFRNSCCLPSVYLHILFKIYCYFRKYSYKWIA